MRILHVVQALSRKFGGVQTVLLDLAKAQAESGIRVDILTTNVDAPTGVLNVPVDRFIQQHEARIWYFPVQFRPLLFSMQFKRYMDIHVYGYDIIHIHGLYRFPSTYAAYQARKQGVPYIIRPHGSLDPYLYAKSSRSVVLKRLYERWFDLPNLHAAGA
ncbi:MAG TPA: glycosyltransferase, partial [Gammaproteobacteria bacterium]|nr:glycosyltransferase [Gammaproteobacteria bacterium]